MQDQTKSTEEPFKQLAPESQKETQNNITAFQGPVARPVPRTERKDFRSYKVGDVFESTEETIEYIFQLNSEFIIFRSASGSLGYFVRETNQKYDAAVSELSKVMVEAAALRGAYANDLISVAAQSLRSAFLARDATNVERHFDLVRDFIKDRGPIQSVYGYGAGFIVFLNKSNRIEVQHKKLPENLHSVVREFQRLQHIARSTLKEDDRNEVYAILGSDLASAFRSPDESDPSSFLISSREFIANRSEALLRSRYVRDSIFSAFVFLLILAPIAYYLRAHQFDQWIITLGGIGGIIGASISIVQRGASLSVNPFVPIHHVVFQGIMRTLLGAVFGALLVVASRANIALGVIQGNTYSLFVFSIVAGLSERFVPDILDRIAAEPPHSTPPHKD